MKKRHIALALALAPMLALVSCDTTSSSSDPIGSGSEGTSQSNGEGETPVGGGEGFHVEEGIPDKKGDITEEAFLAFMAEVASAITGEEIPDPSLEDMPESFLPTLSKGGWTDALLEDIAPVLTSEGAVSLIQSVMMASSGMPVDPTMIPGMVGQAYDVLGELLPIVDEDQFAAILVAGFSTWTVSAGTSAPLFAFGLNYEIQEEVLEVAKEDPAALAFFEGVIERSDYGVDPSVYEGWNEETEELLWIGGRMVHGVLSAIIENFEKTELASLVDSILALTATTSGAAPSAEDVLALLHGAGKILLNCLPDGESLSLLFGKVGALPSMSRECFENEILVHGYWGGNVWNEDPLTGLPPLGGDFRTLLTFLGTMLENAELEHAEAILAFAEASTSTDPAAMEAMAGAMVSLSKLYVEALGLMGDKADEVAPALESVLSFALGQDSYETQSSSSGDSYEFQITKTTNALDKEALASLLDAIELMADLDMENPDPDLMLEISAAMEAASALATSESETYLLAYEESGPVGESYPAPTVTKAEETGETPVEHVLSGIDTSAPGQGLATITFEDIEFLFRYEVSDIDRKVSYLELRHENGYFSSDVSKTLAFSPDMGSIQEISYRTTDGVSVAVPVEDLIGFDLSVPEGIFILPLSEEGASQPSEYRAVPYVVLGEEA